MSTLALLGAVAIGLSLGITGAGGSILTLPVLVHLAGIPPREAVSLSLLIVGSAALAGAWQRARLREVHFRATALFAGSGAAGAACGAKLTPLFSPTALMLMFAVLMTIISIRMLFPPKSGIQPAPECRPARCLLAGLGVGLLTGFLGVGGGFLLMPALVKFARLPLRSATGTSLAIITCNSFAGFFFHLGEVPTPWLQAGVFSAVAVTAVLAGGSFAAKLPEPALRKTFALLVLITAGFVFWRA